MKPFGWKTLIGVLLVLLLAIPAWALKAVAPGTVNYAEGEATLENQPLDKDSIGAVDLRPGQVLNTGAEGKTEVLLGPGQIFRLGDHSEARMISEHPAEVELTAGQATVQLLPNRTGAVLIREAGAAARLEKAGLYFFDAEHAKVFVYKGEAEVQAGNQTVTIKSGRVLDLNQGEKLRASKFDKKELEKNELVQFSGLRSEYLAEASTDAAYGYSNNSAGWYGPGWYWSPAFWTYTYIPGGDYYCDPFGWCFYSPFWVAGSPFLYSGYFNDCGVGSFGHTHKGPDRLPGSFAKFNQSGAPGSSPGPAAMAGNAGAFAGSTTAPSSAFNHSGFNRGNVGGGAPGGGGARGAFSGAHAGGGFSGAHAAPSGGGGGFGRR